jgi:tRNA threonylcarbamoyl adenosine modification protein YeaZ/ribosomal-protein-alanine acetyltransferase
MRIEQGQRPMILLAIDTALASCSACVYDSSQHKILAEERELMERGHAEALPPMVARVISAAEVGYHDLNRIAVTTGPGTFTGIRIGLSFARALGLSLNIKVVGIDTPTALRFANSSDGLPSAAGFADHAARLPEPDAMPNPNYLRDADAKPQIGRLRNLPDLQILTADQRDISMLAKLHAACFEVAWDEAAFGILMASPGVGALIAKSAEGPVGLLLYRAVADEAEILTLCVDPNMRRRGAGKTLLESLLARKIPKIFLEVASSNADAIKLYNNAGFRQVGLRQSYYATTGDDALILQWSV